MPLDVDTFAMGVWAREKNVLTDKRGVDIEHTEFIRDVSADSKLGHN